MSRETKIPTTKIPTTEVHVSGWPPLQQSHFNAILVPKPSSAGCCSSKCWYQRERGSFSNQFSISQPLCLTLSCSFLRPWDCELQKHASVFQLLILSSAASEIIYLCIWKWVYVKSSQLKCPGCKLFIDRIIIACLGWSQHNPFKITLKNKKEKLTDKNCPFFFFAVKEW